MNNALRAQLEEHHARGLDEIVLTQPLLRLDSVDSDSYSIRGAFVVRDTNEAELASFTLEVRVPRLFPLLPPTVRELGGRIPRIADRHVNADGTCCVSLPVAYHLDKPKSLHDYVEGAMRSYFIGDAHGEARDSDHDAPALARDSMPADSLPSAGLAA